MFGIDRTCGAMRWRADCTLRKTKPTAAKYRSRHHEPAPVESAEHRSAMRRGPRGLFEADAKRLASSAAAALREKHREPAAQRRARTSGRLFFGYFLLAKQKKVSRHAGRTPALNAARQRTKPRSSQSKRLRPLSPTPLPPRARGKAPGFRYAVSGLHLPALQAASPLPCSPARKPIPARAAA